MKIKLTFKTPDATQNLSCEELELMEDTINKYVKYGELVTIEFDSETGSANVVSAN